MVKLLDEMRPESAPHKAYTCFRYAPPLTEDVVEQMRADGVKRAIAFSQYPQWSCTTAGSSMNHLWRELKRLGAEEEFEWSVIDRWPTHPTYIDALTRRVEMGLEQLPEGPARDNAVIMFTAHSLPMYVVERGDAYPQEVGATVQAVVDKLKASDRSRSVRHVLTWQSKVGPLPWLVPQTGTALKQLAAQGHKSVCLVPVAFTSDHIETLYELDIEYREEAEEAGIQHFARAPSLNDEPLLQQAQAEIVKEHLDAGELCSPLYQLNCAGCTNPACRSMLNPVGGKYSKLRHSTGGASCVEQWPPEGDKGTPQPAALTDERGLSHIKA